MPTARMPTTEPAARQRPFAESKPKDKCGDNMWRVYLDAAEDEDEASVESWNGSTTGILTFVRTAPPSSSQFPIHSCTQTGLFAATVAAFVIESYKALSPDTGAQTVALLAQLVAATNNTPVIPAIDIQSGPFLTPETAVVVNSLWFLSLVISLICALLATLIQEWTRDYLRDVHRRTSATTISQFALNHVYVRIGVERWGLEKVATLIVGLMHLAVGLFLVGLGLFLFSIHPTPASIAVGSASVAAVLYICVSCLFLFDNSCPYRTPLTYGLNKLNRGLVLCLLTLLSLLNSIYVVSDDAIAMLLRTAGGSNYRPIKPVRKLRDVFVDLTHSQRIDSLTVSPARCIPENKSSTNGWHGDEAPFNSFLNPAHMDLIWKYTGEHLLGPDRPALLDYIPLRLLRSRWHENKPFIHDLFCHLAEKYDAMKQMTSSLQYVSEIIGALKLMHEALAVVDRVPQGERLVRGTPNRGAFILRDNFTWQLIPKIGLINYTACAEGDMTWLIALSTSRQALFMSAPSKLRGYSGVSREGFVKAFEEVRGFCLLPLFAEDRSILEYDLDSYEDWKDNTLTRTGAPHMAARNVLTLVTHFVLCSPDDGWKFDVERAMEDALYSTWETLFDGTEWQNTSDLAVLPDFGLSLFFGLRPWETEIERRPASSLFMTIVHRAGLSSWLEKRGSAPRTPEDFPAEEGMKVPYFVYMLLRRLAHLVTFPEEQVLLTDRELEQHDLIVLRKADPVDNHLSAAIAQNIEVPHMAHDTSSATAADVDNSDRPAGHDLTEISNEVDQGGSAVPVVLDTVGGDSSPFLNSTFQLNASHNAHAVEMAATNSERRFTISEGDELPSSLALQQADGSTSIAMISHPLSDGIIHSHAGIRGQSVETATASSGDHSTAQATTGEENQPSSGRALQRAARANTSVVILPRPLSDSIPESNTPTTALDIGAAMANSRTQSTIGEESEPPNSPSLQRAEEGGLYVGQDVGHGGNE